MSIRSALSLHRRAGDDPPEWAAELALDPAQDPALAGPIPGARPVEPARPAGIEGLQPRSAGLSAAGGFSRPGSLVAPRVSLQQRLQRPLRAAQAGGAGSRGVRNGVPDQLLPPDGDRQGVQEACSDWIRPFVSGAAGDLESAARIAAAIPSDGRPMVEHYARLLRQCFGLELQPGHFGRGAWLALQAFAETFKGGGLLVTYRGRDAGGRMRDATLVVQRQLDGSWLQTNGQRGAERRFDSLLACLHEHLRRSGPDGLRLLPRLPPPAA